MALSLNDVRARIDLDEIDYPALAAALGPPALPHLQALVAGRNAMVASKAAYLAGLIGGPGAVAVVQAAAHRAEPEVRVAAASSLGNLAPSLVEGLAERLLGDAEVGVRKQAVKSVAGLRSPLLQKRVKEMAQKDPDTLIRSLATKVSSAP
jgi:HEAT repeat protein